MNENIIFVPFAFTEKAKSGENITVKGEEIKTLYLENAAVALCSAKYYNPTCTVALVTNLAEEQIPSAIKHVLDQWGVEIKQISFNRFVFPQDYKWSLAFYKLCALSHIVEQNIYQKLCYLDADVYVQKSFDAIWHQVEQKILLVDNKQDLTDENYRIFVEELQTFLQNKVLPTHWEGGFFAATQEDAALFLQRADVTYHQMLDRKVQTLMGDEFILGVAAEQLSDRTQDAGKYAAHYWTSPMRFSVTDSYHSATMAVLHLPAEKQRGMITLYNRFISKHQLPTPAQVHKICRLSGQPFVDKLARLILLGMNAFLTEGQIRAFKQKMRSLVRRR